MKIQQITSKPIEKFINQSKRFNRKHSNKSLEEENVTMQEQGLYAGKVAVFTKGEEKQWMKVG